MKNSLSKALLCGVLASTFLMVNCQKAPSRGVRAEKGNSSDQSIQEKLAKLKVADCSESFIDAIQKSRAVKDKIKIVIDANAQKDHKDLTDAEKTDLKTLRLDLIEKNKITQAEMDKMKVAEAQAEACKKGNDSYIFEEIKSGMNDVTIKAGELAGVDDQGQKDLIQARTERLTRLETSTFDQGAKLVVSADLAAVMTQANLMGVVYFKNASIIKESSSFETDKADKTKTICYLSDISSEDQKISALDTVNVNLVENLKKVDNRSVLTVRIGKGDSFYTIKCLIADAKVSSYKTEFRAAFGKNLRTLKEVELSKTTSLDALTKAHDEAVTKSKELEDQLNPLELKITEAQDKEDATLVQSLKEQRAKLIEKIDQAEKDEAKALAALDAAKK